MLTAFKTPMGILCHCLLSPPLLASAISQHSARFCLSPNLSERISHPLLLQLLAASLLISPSAPLLLCLLSYISTPPPFFSLLSAFSLPLTSFIFIFFWVWSLPMLNFPQFPCPVISLPHLILFSCCRPPPLLILLLSLLLIGRGGGRGGGG